MEASGKHSFEMRTLGDGMDSSMLLFTDLISKNLKPGKPLSNNSLRPIIPEGRILKTIPKYIPKERVKSRCLVKKPKEPKFVPYEPFKGAVDPIIPRKRSLLVKCPPPTKNNVDIQDLVHQMAEMRTTELNKVKNEALESNEMLISMRQWEEEKRAYETDIKNLRETNAHLENQLKFQAQVNSELKTLLVAAVGEDLESRVQHLTEDKLQLARALLNSANHLTSHQEQTEWLSGQCEVWRSKFLASSLMVEELARWKSALSNRINELQENAKVLLDERNNVRLYSLRTHALLQHLTSPAAAVKPLKNANIIDLCLNNQQLTEELWKQTSQTAHLPSQDDQLKITNTPGENTAVRLLKSPVMLPGKTDAICNILMGAAMNMGTGKQFGQNRTACCKHCTGDVHDI